MKQMIKYYIRFILFGAASFFGIFAILKECEQWFNIKFFKEILIAIGIIIGVLTIIASIIFPADLLKFYRRNKPSVMTLGTVERRMQFVKI